MSPLPEREEERAEQDRRERRRERDDRGRPQNARPRDELGRPLPRGAQGVPRVPEDLVLPPEEALREAQRLLDAGMPFHAHEVLEGVWKSAPEHERDLWQGLAQLAVGLTHHLRGRPRGAAVLLERGRGRVAPWASTGPAAGQGAAALVDVDGLLRWSQDLLDVVRSAGPADDADPPLEPPRTPRLGRRDGAGSTGARLRLERRALTPQEAADVAAWRYPAPHDRHDLGPHDVPALQVRSSSGRDGYEPVLDQEGCVVALVCLGVEATVPGQPHRTAAAAPDAPPAGGVLDVGLGVRPDLLSSGTGGLALAALVAALAAEASPPHELRAVAREQDGRALAVLARAGLTARARFPGPGGDVFVELRGALAALGEAPAS
nr:DUF309 domain-containing protein [uncultured Pseudokineococcus sp.]